MRYIKLIILFSFLFLIGYLLYLKNLNDKLTNDVNNLTDELFVKTDSIAVYKNELNQEVVSNITYSKTIDKLETSNDSIERKMFEVIKASNLKLKQVKTITVIKIVTRDVLKVDSTIQIDSIPCNEIRYYSDPFINIAAFPDSVDYQLFSSYTIIDASRMIDRDFFIWRLIGWKKLIDRDMVEVVSANPKDKIKIRKVKLIKN